MIEEREKIRQYIQMYPDTRSTHQTKLRILKKGPDYISYSVGKPIEIDTEKYTFLDEQVRAYIRICEALCQTYTNNKDFKRIAQTLVLQFEEAHIQDLVTEYPIATLSGIRFGTDTMTDEHGVFKTTEVNLGPVGGPPETIKAQMLLGDEVYPMSSDEYTAHFIHSLNSFYLKACKAFEIDPKPLKRRQLVIVENDEWTPGNFIWLDILKQRGINITIAPKEALVYDEKNNELILNTRTEKKSVDQLILYFHLQDDIIDKSGMNPGELIKSLIHKGVVAESSPLPLIILASKSISGLISQLSNDPHGVLSKRLGLDPNDLEKVKDMFPRTYHWRRKFFEKMETEGFSRTELLAYLKNKGLILKSTRSNLFAGMGVYGTESKKGRKGYEDFFQSLKNEVYKKLVKDDLRHLLDYFFQKEFIISLKRNNPNVDPTRLRLILLALKNNSNSESLEDIASTLNFKTLREIQEILNNSSFKNVEEAEIFFRKFAMIIGDNSDGEKISDEIISYISTFMILPFVIQEKINPSVPTEIRVSGFVGENSSDIISMMSTLKRPENEGELKTLHIIIPK